MAKEKSDISPAEWTIMRVLWTLQSANSKQIISIVQRKSDWKENTIKTLLHRLVEKGFVDTERQGRAFIYRANVSEQETMDQTVDNMFDNLCAMHKGRALLHLIKHTDLSQKDIDQLQTLLSQKATSAPASIDCDCVPGEKMNC